MVLNLIYDFLLLVDPAFHEIQKIFPLLIREAFQPLGLLFARPAASAAPAFSSSHIGRNMRLDLFRIPRGDPIHFILLSAFRRLPGGSLSPAELIVD